MRPERHVADRHGDRAAGVDHVQAAGQAVGRVHRDRAHAAVADVLLHLGHQPSRPESSPSAAGIEISSAL